ncbi:TOMM precursor leader peptide-binding protein [Herbidospora cretacea]|uniref:TOMM precursor leader peptide-binding protein n=1 Tax=Herbidospora cretacea TaxID=28444 RepID=UPI0007734132|nr:TOMM precursor leader peptide-binding protein [Herbidospora cretacea]
MITDVVGSGRLFEAVRARVRSSGVVVVASDADDIGRRRYGSPWLPVHTEAGHVVIGPAAFPGRPGCPTCVERRRAGNREHFSVRLRDRPALLTSLVAGTVGELVADEVEHLLADPSTALTSGAMLRMPVLTGTLARHPFLPDPFCPVCGDRPPDGPRPVVFTPQPKVSGFRVGTLDLAELERRYVDRETGVVRSVEADARDGAVAVARLNPARAAHESHHGFGRCEDVPAAKATAVAEALERLAGFSPRGRRTTVRAAYDDIAGQALDPRLLGLYPDDWYDRPGFWFTRFDPARETAWVWGHSFRRGGPVLVPETSVYFGARPDRGFAYECSNGCALGGSLAEAILYGLLEVAERDAFLTTWYARLPLPRVDLRSARDRRVPMAAERIGDRLGYDVHAHVVTLEQGLPVFWITAVDRSGRSDRPKAMCGGAAHLDPERALRRALDEMGPMLANHVARYDEGEAARLVADSGEVRLLEHHPLVYGHPKAYERLEFLPNGAELTVGELPEWPAHDDLADDLRDLVARFLASGMDVIAVDTTSPEAAAGGFACAKVIVPGAAPMTFGHHHRRVHGLPRLLTRGRALGYLHRDLAADDLSPYPHPFP